MAEILLKEIGPYSFVLMAFLIMFTFLLKIIRDERKDKKEELDKTRQILVELNHKMNTVMFETKRAMDELKISR